MQAADELAHTGECNPEEIYSVAKQLNTHIGAFAARVQQRHRLLNMAVLFYTHEQEVRLVDLKDTKKQRTRTVLQYAVNYFVQSLILH